jgi:putative hydrolase of the HAD superfamily
MDVGSPGWRGLLVDYGGVLTASISASFEVFCAPEGLPHDRVTTLFRNDPNARQLLADLETGTLPVYAFEAGLAERLGVHADGLIGRLLGDARPDRVMRAAVRTARQQGIRTGLVSNSWDRNGYDWQELAELFDDVVISADVGVRKPTPAIYVRATAAIGVAPEHCVFVDDLPWNLTPARELGMATVLHHDAATTIPALAEVLGIDLGEQ